VGIIDLFRPQPSLASLVKLPPAKASAPARAAVDFAGKLGAQLATAVGSWMPPRRGSYELLVAYAELPWLHSVVRRRAEALAQVEWLLYRTTSSARRREIRRLVRSGLGLAPHESAKASARKSRALAQLIKAGEVELVTRHPLLDLLETPWPGAGSEAALWELSSKYHDLVGENLFAIERDRKRMPAELLPVPPTWIAQVPVPGQPKFTLRIPRGKQLDIPVTDAIWIRQHDPADPFLGRGVGTAAAASDELDTDEYMALTAKSRFANRAIPEMVLALMGAPPIEPPPTAAALTEIAEQLEDKHRGSERAGQLHLISGDAKALPMGTSMVENQYVQGREFLRNTCMQLFGVPPEVLGVLDNANRSTIDAAAMHFATYSTVPVLERFRSALQIQLVPEYGADLVLDYVSPIHADKEFDRSVMIALPAAFTKNEIRALAGRDARDDGDDLYAAPTGAVPVPGNDNGGGDQAPNAKAKATTEVEAEGDGG
jgi:phage portal protein BeeE